MFEQDKKGSHLTEQEVKIIIKATVKDTLTQLGVDNENPIEMQKDFQHLRDWRETTEAVKRKSLLTVISLLATGAVTAVVMAIKGAGSN